MNKKSFFLLTVMFPILIHAFESKKELSAVIVKSSCECTKTIPLRDKESAYMNMGMCFYRAAVPHKKDIKNFYGFQLNPDNTSKLTKVLMDDILLGCPNLSDTIAKIDSLERSFHLEGVVDDIQKKQFVKLILKNEKGKKFQLLWLSEFKNSAQYKNDIDILKGKSIKVEATQVEYFNPENREYGIYYVITNLEIPSQK